MVISYTARPSERLDINYTGVLSFIYKDMIYVTVCQVRRSPNVFMYVIIWDEDPLLPFIFFQAAEFNFTSQLSV